jgi:dihydroorotase
MPSTKPAIHSKSDVEFIKTKTANNIVQVIPTGSLSIERNGKDLSEMYDMWMAGARAFTDDKRPVQDSGLMLRALLYSKNFGGLVMSYAEDKNLSATGQMNEGESNVSLGMKGMPALAEEVMINRDLFLAEYADAPLHISLVSSAKSVDLIREAKRKGIKVTADAAIHNMVLDDSSLESFDTNYKVKPPLRTKADIEALINGIKDGTIDCICTDHTPEDIENKKKEFELANFGMIGLQSAFGLMNRVFQKHLPIEKIIALITINPRKILGLTQPSIKEGEQANITLFDSSKEWILTESMLVSKSKNTPFIGEKLLGKAVAIINNGQLTECA